MTPQGLAAAAKIMGVSKAELAEKTAQGLARCPACMQWLPFDAYYPDKNRSTGRYTYCKECCSNKGKCAFCGERYPDTVVRHYGFRARVHSKCKPEVLEAI